MQAAKSSRGTGETSAGRWSQAVLFYGMKKGSLGEIRNVLLVLWYE
ncbi:hypothetical protein ACFL6M_04420 [Candidatus Eisenbacteria bacterium]|uniref:Uncharacterized protein n=1 Tax=Eiseniibacteriota bacterium TaxID=2212470 RepID=A0ABV6YKG4_UNCEI